MLPSPGGGGGCGDASESLLGAGKVRNDGVRKIWKGSCLLRKGLGNNAREGMAGDMARGGGSCREVKGETRCRIISYLTKPLSSFKR